MAASSNTVWARLSPGLLVPLHAFLLYLLLHASSSRSRLNYSLLGDVDAKNHALRTAKGDLEKLRDAHNTLEHSVIQLRDRKEDKEKDVMHLTDVQVARLAPPVCVVSLRCCARTRRTLMPWIGRILTGNL